MRAPGRTMSAGKDLPPKYNVGDIAVITETIFIDGPNSCVYLPGQLLSIVGYYDETFYVFICSTCKLGECSIRFVDRNSSLYTGNISDEFARLIRLNNMQIILDK